MQGARNVNILLFDDVELLDFCGPFEVFSAVGRVRVEEQPFNLHAVAETMEPVKSRGGLSINPCCTLETCPPSDILVVPGGYGTRREMRNPVLVDWIAHAAAQTELTLSVCTGALLLATAGVLDGLSATTHHNAMDLLVKSAPHTRVLPDHRIVDNGKVVVSAGISAGIDMALYVVGRLLGPMAAVETAHYMEYDWQPEKYGVSG